MGSLNDYRWQQETKRQPAKKLRFRGFWLQMALALVLVVAVAALVGYEGAAGNAARYLVGQGLAAENSWFGYGYDSPGSVVAADADVPALPAQTQTPLTFMAPASGVVVKGLVLDAAGFSTDMGIVIQGMAGQTVKSTAAGEVAYLGESESGFILELNHAAGFSSVYQGLSELVVGAGDVVSAGAALGVTATGELTFSLYQDGEELDPLSYLFKQEV